MFTGTPYYTGSLDITVTVTDDAGLSATQQYILNVASSPPNYPPVITSTPSTLAATSKAYSYQVTYTDQDSDTQTFTLSTTYTGGNGPTINSTTGLVSWATPVAGTYQFTVTDTDAGGLQSIQTYTLTVELDTAPTMTAIPNSTITAGTLYRYDVQASDSDRDALTYSLTGTNLPSWLSIDQYGRISGTPPVLANTASP